MIVKNEAARLDECLASVEAVADEIVVGDTGSTDATVDIALRRAARVISVPWENDFARARNRVLAEAAGDWLLHLDADEVLDPMNAQRIRRFVDDDGAGADALEVVLANYCDEPRAWRWTACTPEDTYARGHSGYIHTDLLRLFRNRRGFEYREPIHENITESVREQGGIILRVPVVIHHYGHDAHRNDDKARFYLEMGKRKVEQRPQDPKAWHELAEQWLAIGEALEAEAACRRALGLDPARVGPATCLANILCNRGDFDEAREILEGLVSAGHRLPHILTALGALACRQGRYDEGRAFLEAAVTTAPASVMALLHFARALDLCGEIDAARTRLEEALETAAGLPEVRHRLESHRLRLSGEKLALIGSHAEALKVLVEALRLDSEDPLTHRALAGVLFALGHPERAAESLARANLLALQPHDRP